MWGSRESSRVCCTTISTSERMTEEIGRVARNLFRVAEVVEPQVARAPRFERQAVGARGLTVLEIEGDLDRRGRIRRVQDAGGLVRDEIARVGK